MPRPFRDISVFAENQELGANRIDVRTIDRKKRQVIALEMSCSWIESRSKKEEEKTLKYSPLRWELKQLYPRYEIDILGNNTTLFKFKNMFRQKLLPSSV